MSLAKVLGVHPNTIAKINRGVTFASLNLACKMAILARDGGADCDLAEWRPDLLEEPIWSEIVRMVYHHKKTKAPPPK